MPPVSELKRLKPNRNRDQIKKDKKIQYLHKLFLEQAFNRNRFPDNLTIEFLMILTNKSSSSINVIRIFFL